MTFQSWSFLKAIVRYSFQRQVFRILSFKIYFWKISKNWKKILKFQWRREAIGLKIIPCHSIRWSDNHCKRFPSQWPMHVHCYNYCLPISRRAIIIANCTLCIVFTKVIPRPVIHANVRVVDFKYYSIKISFMNVSIN